MKDVVKHVNIFLRFDAWKNPLAKVAVLLPLGALCGPGAQIPNLTNLDRFGPCRIAFPHIIQTFERFLVKNAKKTIRLP